MEAPIPPTGGAPPTAFLLELTNQQSRLYAAIAAMLAGAAGAQDILQETNVVLLRKAAEYDATRPFLPWALAFARFEVLAWRKRQSRDRLILDDHVVAALADRLSEPDSPAGAGGAGGAGSSDSDRLDQLERCRSRLSPESRRLLELRYAQGRSLREISGQLGRSENAVSVTLFRVRQALLRCMSGHASTAPASATPTPSEVG